jgi:DNA helicase HerA-like ATPase
MSDDPANQPGKILIGKGDVFQYLQLPLGNRHGLVAGATGTGKTVTLQVLAEGFSNAGAAVFCADVKGDLSGLAMAGEGKAPFLQRAKDIGVTYTPDRFPVVFWDVFGEQGHPVRATLSEMGPVLLARLLDLNDVQEGVLNIAFRIADEQGLLLLDLKDLRALLAMVSDNASELTKQYGNVAPATVGAIQRQLLVLENQGADKFFGEPALSIEDFIRTDRDGRGVINVLAADKLMRSPKLYATFLLWMLSELFETLPEVGDADKPKLVFFFDEAHLLFDSAPKNLMTAIEQVVRLIRSKGVGVYFITQNPLDVPDVVLGQLGNRAQHALRAFTPRDQKAVKAAAETFRQNPTFDTGEVITQLGVGEALVSMLEKGGTPAVVSRTLIAPPGSRVGPITAEERAAVLAQSPLRGKYDVTIDRDSAFEVLNRRGTQMVEKAPPGAPAPSSWGAPHQAPPSAQPSPSPWTHPNAPPTAPAPEAPSQGGILDSIGGALGGMFGNGGSGGASSGGRSNRMSTGEMILRSAAQSAARSIGTQITRAILRNVLGGMRR